MEHHLRHHRPYPSYSRTRASNCRLLLLIISLCISIFFSCKKEKPVAHNTIEMPQKLSDFGIFKNNPAELKASDSFQLYELNSQLYTDYAEKQRLIKIPGGASMVAVDNGLLNFPDGTVLVKTFFYFNDKRNPSAGKKIIETRVLQKVTGVWNAGTYVWGEDQADARLTMTERNMPVSWINETGIAHSTSYHVPAINECASCHNSGNAMLPVGVKARNLNRTVLRQGIMQNQLDYFHDRGIMNKVLTSDFEQLPDYNNPAEGLERRARAYFEMNCAHCHRQGGYNKNRVLYLGYEQSFEATNLKRYQDLIVLRMKQGKMPKLGKTIIHEEGLALIKAYVDSLP